MNIDARYLHDAIDDREFYLDISVENPNDGDIEEYTVGRLKKIDIDIVYLLPYNEHFAKNIKVIDKTNNTEKLIDPSLVGFILNFSKSYDIFYEEKWIYTLGTFSGWNIKTRNAFHHYDFEYDYEDEDTENDIYWGESMCGFISSPNYSQPC